jgi:6-phosphogluconolactonase (cycloisomerase 2 family)
MSVTVDSSGKFAYAANYGDGTIWVYTINQTTGALIHVSKGSTGMAGVYPQCVTTTTGAI